MLVWVAANTRIYAVRCIYAVLITENQNDMKKLIHIQGHPFFVTRQKVFAVFYRYTTSDGFTGSLKQIINHLKKRK